MARLGLDVGRVLPLKLLKFSEIFFRDYAEITPFFGQTGFSEAIRLDDLKLLSYASYCAWIYTRLPLWLSSYLTVKLLLG
ncbi:MAG: hypothetical protein HLUCCO16_00480 [Phormidium sp. OSCR]|nr:MAG: hypothetical protein HLUCCO16_00480 [Phormidium sp. OSCR]